jgi:hypothetical protein
LYPKGFGDLTFHNQKTATVTHPEKLKTTHNYNQSTLKHKLKTKNNPKHNPPGKNSTQTPTTTIKQKTLTLIQGM